MVFSTTYLLIAITFSTGAQEILSIKYPTYEKCEAAVAATIASKKQFPPEVVAVNYLCVSKST